MRKWIFGLFVLFRSCTPAFADDAVCFVPGNDDCAQLAAAEIAKAQHTIDMQAFQFTEPHIAQALLDAKARGIAVRLIVDKKAPNERNGQTETVAAAGIPAWVDFHPHIAHNKVIVIDGAEVIGGSFNYTTNADLHNAENMTITHDPQFAALYEQNFADRLGASEPLDQYMAGHSR